MLESEGFWSIKQVCQYLSIRRSMAYSLVESGSIPFYRIGRLLRFKPEDVKNWLESHRSESIDVGKKAREMLKAISRPSMDMDAVVKKTIDHVKGMKYNPSQGNQVESSTRKGGNHGVI